MPKVFSIADGILVAGFDEQSKDHDETLEKKFGYADRQI